MHASTLLACTAGHSVLACWSIIIGFHCWTSCVPKAHKSKALVSQWLEKHLILLALLGCSGG